MSISPIRSYLLVLALIPLIGLSRLAGASSMPSFTILTASGVDALFLLMMLGGYCLASVYFPQGSFQQRLNSIVHLAVAASMLTLLLVAEVLYQRTGEVLDLDVIRFAVSNAGHLHGAIGSALSWQDLASLLTVLILAAIVLPSTSSPLIRRMRALLLIFPWCILSAQAAHEAFAFDDSPVPVGGYYRGRYTAFVNEHGDWLTSQGTPWKRGILTGIVAGKVITQFELQTIESNKSATATYSLPTQLSAPQARHNVLFIVLESIRHDAIGAYQDSTKSKSATPFMDSLAKEGWQVDRTYTTITHTSKALVGIYCGTFARSSPLISESEPDGLPFNCLPKLMGSVGYATAHFQTAPEYFENRTGLLNNLGFETHFTQSSYSDQKWQRYGYLALDDRAMLAPALSWMKAQKTSGKPFLASILTTLTHHPYASPVSDLPISNPAEAYQSYMGGLSYTDELIKELFAEMKSTGLLDNTLVIITGDHGEGFSEHGLLAHNGVAFEEGMRVPMILSGKMLGAPQKISGLRQHLDIIPTIYDLLGIKHDARLPGISLMQRDGHKQIITACFYEDYCLNFYEEQGGKTIYLFGKRPPVQYDVNKDPAEAVDQSSVLATGEMKDKILSALSMRAQFDLLFDPYAKGIAGNGRQ